MSTSIRRKGIPLIFTAAWVGAGPMACDHRGSGQGGPTGAVEVGHSAKAGDGGEGEAGRESGVGSMEKVVRSEEEWRRMLTPEQYYVLRQKGTERAFTGKYWNSKTPGEYRCAGCGEVLFKSDSKFDSGCGWPSFDRAIADGKIEEHEDRSHGMIRTEVVCARCGGHLGHLFDDGPTETGMRYCINSAAIEHEPKKAEGGGKD